MGSKLQFWGKLIGEEQVSFGFVFGSSHSGGGGFGCVGVFVLCAQPARDAVYYVL